MCSTKSAECNESMTRMITGIQKEYMQMKNKII